MEENLKLLLEEKAKLASQIADRKAKLDETLKGIDADFETYKSTNILDAKEQQNKFDGIKAEYSKNAELEIAKLQKSIDENNSKIGFEMKSIRNQILSQTIALEKQIKEQDEAIDNAKKALEEAEAQYNHEMMSLYYRGEDVVPNNSKVIEAQTLVDRLTTERAELQTTLDDKNEYMKRISQFFGTIMIKDKTAKEIQEVLFGDKKEPEVLSTDNVISGEPVKDEHEEDKGDEEVPETEGVSSEEVPTSAETNNGIDGKGTTDDPFIGVDFEDVTGSTTQGDEFAVDLSSSQGLDEQDVIDGINVVDARGEKTDGKIEVTGEFDIPQVSSQGGKIENPYVDSARTTEQESDIYHTLQFGEKYEKTLADETVETKDKITSKNLLLLALQGKSILKSIEMDVSTGKIKVEIGDGTDQSIDLGEVDLVDLEEEMVSDKALRTKYMEEMQVRLPKKVDPYMLHGIHKALKTYLLAQELTESEIHSVLKSVDNQYINFISDKYVGIDFEDNNAFDIYYYKTNSASIARMGRKTLEKSVMPYMRNIDKMEKGLVAYNIDMRTPFGKMKDFFKDAFSKAKNLLPAPKNKRSKDIESDDGPTYEDLADEEESPSINAPEAYIDKLREQDGIDADKDYTSVDTVFENAPVQEGQSQGEQNKDDGPDLGEE